MTELQTLVQQKLEALLETFKDNEDVSIPIQTAYTAYMAQVNLSHPCPPNYIWNGTQCVPDVG